ncbi:LysR family transcriptional regulator [Actinoplanes sp. TBRC 11911]|uniref:LysR family transcriptional regulator n=1 Tax=Actinoplanes sp. TBRC 11911 TaxID=2729386 RepID=UPI00145C6898|nr:LysR family transcriptional regulator [Actinoplanes sp. TBRC 11911]NMO55215.1 LysR family transcriptional regulator [Actinoplanes sp. TBRC 11911]
MDRLEIRDLEYFVAIGEELHFGRAAERLGIAQPPLSRAISRIERRMKVRLLERTSRRVELTPAGVILLEEGRGVLQSLDAAVLRARRAAEPGPVVLAVYPGAASQFLARLVRAAEMPELTLKFTRDTPAAVQDGTADAALVCLSTDDVAGFETISLTRERSMALVPRDHHLAAAAAVPAAALRREPGFEEYPPASLDEIVDRVAAGLLVTVVGDSIAARLPPAVVGVTVTDLPPSDLALVWPAPVRRPELHMLARAAKTLADEPAARQT